MINIFKTVENQLLEVQDFSGGVWVHLTDPSPQELQQVKEALHIESDFLKAALDEEEMPRLESEAGQTLIIVDIPIVEPEGKSFMYNTIPLGIILGEDCIVTVCLEESMLIEDFMANRVKGFYTFKRTRFILQLLYRSASRYLQFLRQIEKASTQVEEELHKSMKNRELIQMLRLEKSLVFFSTSLTANEVVLEKMMKMDYVKKYPDDTDLLEDVIIENKQAIEMCNIYRDILSGTMDAFASVISNNLNIVMKFLAAATIIIAIPSLIAAYWGMNVSNIPFEGHPLGFWIVVGISIIAGGLGGFVLWRKKMM